MTSIALCSFKANLFFILTYTNDLACYNHYHIRDDLSKKSQGLHTSVEQKVYKTSTYLLKYQSQMGHFRMKAIQLLFLIGTLAIVAFASKY